MKYFLFLVYILGSISFISADTTTEQMQEALSDMYFHIMSTCRDEFILTEDQLYSVEEIMNNTYTEPGNEEKNRKIGCFFECFLKKAEMMVGSNIKEEKIHEEIDKLIDDSVLRHKFHKMAYKCINEAKNITQECEKGFSIHICRVKDYETRIRWPMLHGNNEDD